MTDYTLNIDEYSELELFKLIKYDEDIHEANKEKISTKVDKMIVKINKSEKMDSNKKFEYEMFLLNIREKLVNYIEKYNNFKINRSHETIIPKDNKLLFNVNQTNKEYPVGLINPIEKRVIKKTISIDSLFRENFQNTSSSDFIWKLPGSQNKVISLRIASIELPIMWYTISEKNKSNLMKINLYNIPITTTSPNANETHIISIPSGNYSAHEFSLYINNYFSLIGKGLDNLICEVNPITAKTMIRVKNKLDTDNSPYNNCGCHFSPEFYFELNFAVNHEKYRDTTSVYQPYTLGTFLGFKKAFYRVTRQNKHYITNNVDTTSYEGYLESEAAYGNGRINYVFISIDDYNKNCISNPVIASSRQYIGDEIIGRIPITQNFTAIMSNNGADTIFKQREYLGPVNIEKLHIKILDKYGNVVDFNNNDLSMAIELTEIYS